jgi:hypothetical protein
MIHISDKTITAILDAAGWNRWITPISAVETLCDCKCTLNPDGLDDVPGKWVLEFNTQEQETIFRLKYSEYL